MTAATTATVTPASEGLVATTAASPAGGDPHGPLMRYVSLVRETTTLRGFNTWAIAPTYMEEIQERILDGMETELVDPVAVVEDVVENYPERCGEVCVRGHLTIFDRDGPHREERSNRYILTVRTVRVG